MAAKPSVAEPFGSRRQAALFGLLLAGILALPALLSALGLQRRRDAYREIPSSAGAYSFIEHQALDESADLDLLFLASSLLWVGVDTPYVAAELARAEGHPVRVFTFGYNHRGEDIAYGILRDTLAHRRVKTLVVTMPSSLDGEDGPHPYAHHFFPWGEDPAVTRDLPLRQRLELYAADVLGAPRHLVSLLRPNPDWIHPAAATLGASPIEQGFLGEAYAPLAVDPPGIAADRLVYAPATAGRFAFTGQALTPYQDHFLRLLGALAREHAVRVIVLHVPRYRERASGVVEERFVWSTILGVDAAIAGVPPAELFQGLDEAAIQRLYYNDHLNASGAALFTRTITPALLRLHEDAR